MFWRLLLFLILSRVVAFLILQTGRVSNDSGIAVIPLGDPAYLDYRIYQAHLGSAWTEIFRPLIFLEKFCSNSSSSFGWLQSQTLKPGPLLPSLLEWSGYDRSRELLSWLYLFGGTALGACWAIWAGYRGASRALQLLLACFPALVYYSFLVSTDLLYAVIIAAWFFSASAIMERGQSNYWWLCSAMTLLALITRPNALILTPLMVLVAYRSNALKAKLSWSIFWLAIGIYGFVYYLPYYWVHATNANNTDYWGLYPSEYYSGLWLGWPLWIGQPISWLIFAFSKLLYAVGLRPSYSDMATPLVVLRALPGLLFLPGLAYGLKRGRSFDKIFVTIFLIPVFVGAAQERYLLAITPLLALWGFQAIDWMLNPNIKPAR